MAVTINLVSGGKQISLSKVERPINISKVNRQITLAHVGGRGPKGETGDTGPANSLSIGTVTTGDAGTDASATITGDAPSQTLNLTIPQGDTGADGVDGDNGVDGKGFTGGSYSSSTGKVTFTSDDGLGFTTGDLRGQDGTDGSDGAAATITIDSTTTGAPGTDASVTNTGTTSAAKFAFTIPAGAVWHTGAGTPSTTYSDGDLYLNTSNGDVYQQSSDSWGSSIMNLTGPQGSAGAASGLDTQVQFNDGGTFAGDSGLTYNKTTNALTISGDISANNLSGSNTGDQTSVSGNAGTATKLKNARTIGGVSFDGSANIDLPGVNTSGNQDTTGNAATATKLATARQIAGQSFDGSADISIKATDLNLSGTASTSKYLRGDNQWVTPPNTTYSAMSVAEGETGAATTSRVIRADYLKTIVQYYISDALTTMNADVTYGWQ